MQKNYDEMKGMRPKPIQKKKTKTSTKKNNKKHKNGNKE